MFIKTTNNKRSRPQLKAPHEATEWILICQIDIFRVKNGLSGSSQLVSPSVLLLQDSEKYVEQLLTLFNRFSRLVKEAFQDDPRFLTARDKVSGRFPEAGVVVGHACQKMF